MMSLSLNQLLMLFMWFPLSALLLFMFLIARFYEMFSKRRTFFRLYLLPIVLFGVSSVRYASADVLLGDPFADIASGLGGICLLGLSIRLYWLMIVKNQQR
ncbi:MAG: hypothetical protein CUN56_05590 [Phototrophicales bacterium]|nr:MAG: hypothetical protein CUN56_05590 [Phototrophicales bacterium]RMG70750.1 MAG: hypothetical protein D6711_16595 [Chloroflexota bacterium]